MPGIEIARRTVAFFVIKSSVNFVAVVVVGMRHVARGRAVDAGLLTLGPAVLALAFLAIVPAIGMLGHPSKPRWFALAVESLGDGVREAGRVLARRDWRVFAGAIGYWIFDNAVIWACFRAFGESPADHAGPDGLPDRPARRAAADPGRDRRDRRRPDRRDDRLRAPAAAVAASVLAYRVILFWLPLVLGGIAFASLRKNLNNPDRPDLCDPFGRRIPA